MKIVESIKKRLHEFKNLYIWSDRDMLVAVAVGIGIGFIIGFSQAISSTPVQNCWRPVVG